MRKKHHTGRQLKMARAIQKTVEKVRSEHSKEELAAQYQLYVAAWRKYQKMLKQGIYPSIANHIAKREARLLNTNALSLELPEDQISKQELDDFVQWILLDEYGNSPTDEEILSDAEDQRTN